MRKGLVGRHIASMENIDAPALPVTPAIVPETLPPVPLSPAVTEAVPTVGAPLPVDVSPALNPVEGEGLSETTPIPGTDAVISTEVPLTPDAVVEAPTELNVPEVLAGNVAVQGIEVECTEIQCMSDRADEILSIQKSLENYRGLMRQAGLDGISQETAAFMGVTFKRIDRILGVQRLGTSLEAYTAGGHSNLQRAAISQEDIGKYVQEGYEALKAVIKALIQKIYGAAQNYLNGIKQLDGKVKAVEAQLAKVKGNPQNESITVNSPTFLFTDGQPTYSSTTKLLGIAKFTSDEYPKGLAAYITGLSAVLAQFQPTGDGQDILARMEKVKAPLDGLNNENEKLPGNYRVDIDADGVGFELVNKGSLKEAPATYEHQVRNPAELRRAVKELSIITEIMLDTVHQQEQVRKAGDTFLKTIDKLEKEAKREDYAEADRSNATSTLQGALAMFQKSNPYSEGNTKYMISAVGAYVALAAAEVAQYGSK